MTPRVELVAVASGPLRGFDFAVGAGQAVVVSGRRGAGKHRLMQLVLGLLHPTRGLVRVLGSDLGVLGPSELRAVRARCGFVPSRGALISNLSVRDNVALPLRYHGALVEGEVAERVADALAELGISAVADRRPAELSPVEERLAAIARVRAARPDVVLLEDPFEGLDEAASDRVGALLEAFGSTGCATVLTTHATRLATSYDGRLLRIAGGRIVSLESSSSDAERA